VSSTLIDILGSKILCNSSKKERERGKSINQNYGLIVSSHCILCLVVSLLCAPSSSASSSTCRRATCGNCVARWPRYIYHWATLEIFDFSYFNLCQPPPSTPSALCLWVALLFKISPWFRISFLKFPKFSRFIEPYRQTDRAALQARCNRSIDWLIDWVCSVFWLCFLSDFVLCWVAHKFGGQKKKQ